jgi:chromosome segregation ATPase
VQRIHAPFDEPILSQIDRDVEKSGTSGAQWLSSARAAYMRLLERSKDADPAQMARDAAQLRITNESQWKENQRLKKSEQSALEDVAQMRRKLGALEDQIAPATAELEKSRTDMILLQHDQAHFLDTIMLKDLEIAFLQAHIAQLTQSISQFALKPGEEEIKKRGWWQFWK